MEDNKARTIKICIDNTVYNLTSYSDSTNVLMHLTGTKVAMSENTTDLSVAQAEHCCVFSHLLDVLAYISLAKMSDEICSGIPFCDYMVLKPCHNYSFSYELLKRYKEVHSFLRISKENRVVNSILADLLGFAFVNESFKFYEFEALVSYCMNKQNVIKL